MPSQADGTSDGTNGDGAGRGASLLPEHYADDGAGEAAVVPSSVVPSEAIVVVPAPLRSAAVPDAVTSSGGRFQPGNPHRFPAGKSGNLNGRPKGIVSKALTKELKRKIAASGQTMLQALVSGYVAKALEEQDPARFNSIRDTVDGKPASQDDGTGAAVGIIVQLEIVGK